jgi:hypothetical protein
MGCGLSSIVNDHLSRFCSLMFSLSGKGGKGISLDIALLGVCFTWRMLLSLDLLAIVALGVATCCERQAGRRY